MDTNRQQSIVSSHVIETQHPIIIGVGAVGRVVAETLTCNGLNNISLCDFDTVEAHNKSTQGFFQDDIGKSKVECAAEHLLRINNDLQVNAINDRFRVSHLKAAHKIKPITSAFFCVDSLEVRGMLFKHFSKYLPDVPFFDARLGGEQIRLLSISSEESREYYPSTLSCDETAYQDGCHIPMIKHAANIAASSLVQQYIAAINNRALYTDRLMPLPGSYIQDIFETLKESSSKS